MSSPTRNSQLDRKKRRRFILIAIGLLLLVFFICSSISIGGGIWFIDSVFDGDRQAEQAATAPRWAPDSAELTIAVSPVMAPVLDELAARFNSQEAETADGHAMSVNVVTYEPVKMIEAALDAPEFQAISPDSSLWLDRLEQEWTASIQEDGDDLQIPIGQRRIGEQIRYAVSPIVIAAWESAARDLGWPEESVGWQDIQRQAAEDPDFKWNHPSTNNAAGLLATLAEFYAGAGLTRGLTEAAATDQATLDYVQAVEATVRFYGEGEEVIIERLAEEGRDFLDAFVAQERVVIDWNRNQEGERLVAIYPAEGTLWTDHPMALLELGAQSAELPVTENQRLTYRSFAKFLGTAESQQQLLAEGYRPADLTIDLDAANSPFATSDAVDWRQPQTTLQMPSPAVVDVIRNVWYYTKRPTNVYLVVDSSGSMEGEKIERTREALRAFVEEIKGDQDRVGLIDFGAGIKSFTPLREMDEANRRDLQNVIDNMLAYGGTALLDAVYDATVDLKAQSRTDAINAIVVMTDGRENESRRDVSDLQNLLSGSQQAPLVIFTIGFGSDADEIILRQIAEVGTGQYRPANETDIEELYRIISTYF